MIRRLEELDIFGKRVFVRADFNVPVRKGRITETHRIESTLPTLRFLLAKAAKLLIASHLGSRGGKKAPEWTLPPVRVYLARAFSCAVSVEPDRVGREVEALAQGPTNKVILVETLRFHKEEE